MLACKHLFYLANRAFLLVSLSLTLATGQVCLQECHYPGKRAGLLPIPSVGMLDDCLYFLSEKYLAICTFTGNFWCTFKSTNPHLKFSCRFKTFLAFHLHSPLQTFHAASKVLLALHLYTPHSNFHTSLTFLPFTFRFKHILYVPRSRVRGLVLLALRFPFVFVETYTNSNLDDNKTKPRTRDRGTYSTASEPFLALHLYTTLFTYVPDCPWAVRSRCNVAAVSSVYYDGYVPDCPRGSRTGAVHNTNPINTAKSGTLCKEIFWYC